MRIASRPGYVYVMTNPSLPGWHKIGHTHRPPHRRARELSRTALPTAFDVSFARFFWDAPAAERVAHGALSGEVRAKGKEFFLVCLEQAVEVVRAIEDAGRQENSTADADLSWEETLEGREELWAWAEEDWKNPDPAVSRKGWRAMERLSASGWAEGSWRLADHLVRAQPDLEGGERASWVLDAAYVQGMPEAKLRAAWLRSWKGAEDFERWSCMLKEAIEHYGIHPQDWPARMADTLFAEVSLWKDQPGRRIPGNFSHWMR